jgi:hypothetical protein
MTQEEIYENAGGEPILPHQGNLVVSGTPEGWNFGWIPFEDRSDEERAAHEAALHEMAPLTIDGTSAEGSTQKVALFELWKHPSVVAALGYPFPGIHQRSGSCVGAACGNALFTLLAYEVIRLNDPAVLAIPFWLLPYGRSRFYNGNRRPGNGSTSSLVAKAVRVDGAVDARLHGLPSFATSDGLSWGKATELSWSDGDAPQTIALLPQSRQHLVRTTAYCADANSVRAAIANGYPCISGSRWGGLSTCPTKGNPPVLLNHHATKWNHCMAILGWWEHPELGELFWIQNQWGLNAHGIDAAGGPPGGFWVKKADVDYMCHNGEVYAFSQFAGFPALAVGMDKWLFA